MNPRSNSERKMHFVCLKKIKNKDNNKPAFWVGHSKLGSLDKNKFLKEHHILMKMKLV